MFDDIAALFRENVVESFNSYLESQRTGKAGLSRDLRFAITAATALYHFREHLPAAHSLSRADIVRRCPDYGLLGDVVNASKHKAVTHGSPQIALADQIEECLINTEYEDEEGMYRHVEKQVIIRLTSGAERDLLEVMVSVMNFWQTELAALGIIASRPAYVIPCDPQPRPRAESNDGRLDLEMVQGVRFKQTQCLRKHNYRTGQIEPVDITGSSFELRLFKLRYNVDMVPTNDRTGQQLKRTILLSEEESEQPHNRQGDREKQEYVASLAKAQDAFRELQADAQRIEAAGAAEQPAEPAK